MVVSYFMTTVNGSTTMSSYSNPGNDTSTVSGSAPVATGRFRLLARVNGVGGPSKRPDDVAAPFSASTAAAR